MRRKLDATIDFKFTNNLLLTSKKNH